MHHTDSPQKAPEVFTYPRRQIKWPGQVLLGEVSIAVLLQGQQPQAPGICSGTRQQPQALQAHLAVSLHAPASHCTQSTPFLISEKVAEKRQVVSPGHPLWHHSRRSPTYP